MKVKEIMHAITRLPSYITVSKAAKIMDEKSIGSALVEENGKAIGVMTERDILRKVVAKGKSPDKMTLKDIMNKPIITIDAEDDVVEASKKMDEHKIRRLIVIKNGEIVGKVTANSISRNFKYLLLKEHTAYAKQEPYTPQEYNAYM